MIFDKHWFSKHQQIILWFVNTWVGRRILCINGDKSSVGKNKIVRIDPNAVTWKGIKKNQFVTEFRTHAKFSKRIFYAFYPLWLLAHIWDKLFANPFAPALNLGFDTLTVYPDANPESTSVDGYVQRNVSPSSGTWASIRDGAGTGAGDSDASFPICYLENINGTGTGWQNMVRGINLYDTLSLTASATISAGTLSLWIIGIRDTAFNQSMAVVTSAPASNTSLVMGDFVNLGTIRQASDIDAGSLTAGAYNDFALNATGLGNISKTSITKFGFRYSGDADNSEPVAVTDYIQLNCALADTAGTTNDPRLVVTYTLPAVVAGGYACFI